MTKKSATKKAATKKAATKKAATKKAATKKAATKKAATKKAATKKAATATKKAATATNVYRPTQNSDTMSFKIIKNTINRNKILCEHYGPDLELTTDGNVVLEVPSSTRIVTYERRKYFLKLPALRFNLSYELNCLMNSDNNSDNIVLNYNVYVKALKVAIIDKKTIYKLPLPNISRDGTICCNTCKPLKLKKTQFKNTYNIGDKVAGHICKLNAHGGVFVCHTFDKNNKLFKFNDCDFELLTQQMTHMIKNQLDIFYFSAFNSSNFNQVWEYIDRDRYRKGINHVNACPSSWMSDHLEKWEKATKENKPFDIKYLKHENFRKDFERA